MNNLRKIREFHSFTQEDMATLLGVQRPTYTRYEKGDRQPDYETLKKLAEILHVSIDYLLDYDHPDSKEIKNARKYTKAWLHSTDMTIAEIEERINTNYATIRAWSCGFGDYFNTKLFIISDLIGCPLNTLLGRYNNAVAPNVIETIPRKVAASGGTETEDIEQTVDEKTTF